MKKKIYWYDYIFINIYWFAITSRSQALTPLILPLLIQQFVGESAKGSYVGILRFWGLMMAVLIQSGMGILSDRSTSRWGRRRPFIFFGGFGDVILLLLIGLTAGLEGMNGFWILFILYILSMITSNTSHAGLQGLIPDQVPEEKRGLFSGIKALFEVPVSVIFVSFIIGNLVQSGKLWTAIVVMVFVIILSLVLTMFVKEKPPTRNAQELNIRPFLNLVLMTGVFALIILAAGQVIKFLIRISSDFPSMQGEWFLGMAGFLMMLVAIGIGVWGGVTIGTGVHVRENASFTWWVVNRLAFLVGSTNLATFLLFFVQERYGFQSSDAAGPTVKIVMIVGVFVLLSAIPGGYLTDRYGKKKITAISGLMAGFGTMIIVLIPNLMATYIGGCIVGAGVGLFYVSNWALGTEIVPKDQAGKFLGISNLAGAGAGAIGAYLGGPIADNKSYVLLFFIYGILFFVSILALKGIKVKQEGV